MSSPLSSTLRLTGAAALLLTLVAGSTARAQDQPQPPAPEAPPPEAAPPPAAPSLPAPDPRLDEVDQRTRIVERKLELLDEQAAAAKAATSTVSANDRGFQFKSAENAFVLKVRGLLQVDGREYFRDDALSLKNTFLVRKARPFIEATFFDLADLRIMPDFGGGSTVLQDAFVDLRLAPFFVIRAGKYKTPLALERAQSDAPVVFPERALPTSLAPNRDIGFEILGNIAGGVLFYEGGVVNGAPDNSTEDVDVNRAKDLSGRVFLQPFKTDPYSPLQNFGIGVGGSTGIERGTATAAALPSYRSAGQQVFFAYDAGTFARGRRTRWSPHLYYYVGQFGLMAEYINTKQKVQKGTEATDLTHTAWQLAAYWVFGGKPLFEGNVIDQPFNPKKGTWGALEIGLRYNELDIDDKTFSNNLLAKSDVSASKAQAFGAVLNWDLNRVIRLQVSFEHTKFKGGAPAGADRKPENVLFQRVQASF